ncbi:MAG: SEC-C domain-containing protein [Candidatus Mariimomonas ferrooxydans]
MAEEILGRIIDEYMPSNVNREVWNINKFTNYLKMNFLLSVQGVDFDGDSRGVILDKILEKARDAYAFKEKLIGEDLLRQIEKFEILRVVDSEWIHHLHAMDHLKEGIQLRAYGQRDPLLEYKQEAYKMFFEMEYRVRQKTIEGLFRVQVARKDEVKDSFTPAKQQLIHNEHSALEDSRRRAQEGSQVDFTSAGPSAGQVPAREDRREARGAPNAPFKREAPKVGRNDPCPCGSGKKYKKCCGK